MLFSISVSRRYLKLVFAFSFSNSSVSAASSRCLQSVSSSRVQRHSDVPASGVCGQQAPEGAATTAWGPRDMRASGEAVEIAWRQGKPVGPSVGSLVSLQAEHTVVVACPCGCSGPDSWTVDHSEAGQGITLSAAISSSTHLHSCARGAARRGSTQTADTARVLRKASGGAAESDPGTDHHDRWVEKQTGKTTSITHIGHFHFVFSTMSWEMKIRAQSTRFDPAWKHEFVFSKRNWHCW